MLRRGGFRLDRVEEDALLLVEGIDDARFFAAFLCQLELVGVQIAQVGGKSKFGAFLRATLKIAPNFRRLRRLGIARDADTCASSALQSLRNALTAAGLPSPSTAWEVAREDGLAVSLAILPDGTAPGELEDLCLRTVENSTEVACIEDYVKCRTRSSSPVADKDLAKVKVHSYLAIGKEGRAPGLRLGESAEAGVWDWRSPAFEQVAGFLRNLSAPTPAKGPQ